MIRYLIRLLLKLTNKNDLIQFFDGLNSIGKPTNVMFPGELLEQAALLGMSGLNNTLAIQSNQHWVWPYWVERQLNPASKGFIPTGVNLLTNNLSFRNWTALSIPGNRLEAMLDPVGMLTLEPFSWSTMPYLIIDNNYYIPSKMDIKNIRQTLHKKNWPEIITRYKTHPDIRWFSKCKALNMDQQQVLQQKFIIKNLGEKPLSLTFGMSLRPYNSLTIGHIHKLTCKNNLWKVNGNPALLMLKTPDSMHISNRLLGDPIYVENNRVSEKKIKKIKLKSRSGISTGIAVYNINLQPGERVCYQFLSTDKHSKALGGNKKKAGEWKKELNLAEKHFKQQWKLWAQTGLTLSLPDAYIENAFYAVKNHLSIFDDVEQFTPGSFFYHTGWFRDSAFLSLGFDQAGYFNQVKNKFPGYFKRQTWKGYFKSQDGEWDSTGQALYSIISHIRRTGDKQLLEKYYPKLLKGARWISQTRLTNIDNESPHFGLLPAGLSAEHFGPNDHYYWDNFWSLTGIQQLIWCAKCLKKDRDVIWLDTLFNEYNKDLQQSINDVTQRIDEQALSCSPYRWLDTAAIGNLAAISPMCLIDANEYWVAPTLDYLWQNSVLNGLFFQHIIHSGYNIYLSIQLAKVFLIRQDPRWQTLFKNILASASRTWTWPEAIHPKTGGGCMGDGDHGWAAAEFISLIRDMFVFELQHSLHLGAGLLSEWYDLLHSKDEVATDEAANKDLKHINDLFVRQKQGSIRKKNQCITIDNASTLHGTVSYSLAKHHNDIILTWTIQRNKLQTKVPVYFICTSLKDKYFLEENQAISLNDNSIELLEVTGQYRFKMKTQSHER